MYMLVPRRVSAEEPASARRENGVNADRIGAGDLDNVLWPKHGKHTGLHPGHPIRVTNPEAQRPITRTAKPGSDRCA